MFCSNRATSPFVPAKAGTQGAACSDLSSIALGPLLRGDERWIDYATAQDRGTPMRNKLTLIGSLAIAATLAMTPLHAQTKVEEGVMAVPVVALAFSLGYLADDLNLWEKHGVKVKTVQISGIGAMNSVISGSTDLTQSSGSAVTRAAARGQRLLGIVGTINGPSVQVVLRKDLAAGFDPKAPLVERVKALRGRTIAVDAVNSVIHAYLRYIAKRAGFDPEEIRVAVLQPPNMLAALQTKQIEGFAMAPPWAQQIGRA